MILADTSVWIDHFRISDASLQKVLDQNQVVMHPWIVGELACGNLHDRMGTLRALRELPEIVVATSEEVLQFIERYEVTVKGIGYIDVNLLISAVFDSHEFWTNDLRLFRVAQSLGVPARMPSRRN